MPHLFWLPFGSGLKLPSRTAEAAGSSPVVPTNFLKELEETLTLASYSVRAGAPPMGAKVGRILNVHYGGMLVTASAESRTCVRATNEMLLLCEDKARSTCSRLLGSR